jgi:hypothetical protein
METHMGLIKKPLSSLGILDLKYYSLQRTDNHADVDILNESVLSDLVSGENEKIQMKYIEETKVESGDSCIRCPKS